ncbi:cytidylyltransferase domain-containing protein [Zhouia sp. PK063]|uniref:acylneuraminate cytidylyltransferase family protein n=1 Tax=Zhouia sp. PK063 TaxID=3373602 RepID=UPI0037B401B1
MKILTIIPARKGSKRLPGKNYKLLGEYPLIVHSILYAQENGLKDIVITTDDPQIKAIASQYHIPVVDRPETISGDHATTISALQHVLEVLPKTYDTVILLQPTNPLRPSSLLHEALELYKSGHYDSLMTVSAVTHKLGRISENKFLPYNYELGQRSQEIPPLYFENGLLYIAQTSLIEQGILLGEHHYPLVVAHPFAQIDIDTEEDFIYATYLLNQLK